MFGKFDKNTFKHIFNKSKDFLGKAYNTTKNVLGDVNSGIKTFKNIYEHIAPIFLENKYTQKPARILDGYYGKGLNAYEKVRDDVVKTHDDLKDRIGKIKT